MSLKSFHIVFVTVTVVLFTFMILWGFLLSPEKSSLAMLMGYSGVAGSLIMSVYGVYFVRKLRRIQL